MKKETRKMAAQEKMEQFKTVGGRSAHKVVDPMHESILALMNTKTVKGLNNMFDSDTTNTPNSLSISDASNTLDDVTNSAVYNSNEYDTDTDECIMYEVLDEDYSKETTKTHMSHDVDVINSNTNVLRNKKEKTKTISNWCKYTPDKLKAPIHKSLKVNETNTFENEGATFKENETDLSKTITRRRRPSTIALNSSHISKQYSDLAEIKMELAKLQLIAQKEEMAVKQQQNKIEFELKKKSLELDIALKKEQLKKFQASSLLQ